MHYFQVKVLFRLNQRPIIISRHVNLLVYFLSIFLNDVVLRLPAGKGPRLAEIVLRLENIEQYMK